MLTEEKAQELMVKFIALREKAKETKEPKDLAEMKDHEAKCIQHFSYLITTKTSRYKAFNNYDDLNQEGYQALMKAMANYNPKKGSFFWWAHKYIDTCIARKANLHTTIRYPLKFAKENIPHKETVLPILFEEKLVPDLEYEKAEEMHGLETAMSKLSEQQRKILEKVYGFDGDRPVSINKICKEFGMTRMTCMRLINSSMHILKDNLKS